MIYLWLVVAALCVALVFLVVLFLALKSANELHREDCNNCKNYDRTLHTCWPKFEERFPGDKACDFFQPRKEDEFEPNT